MNLMSKTMKRPNIYLAQTGDEQEIELRIVEGVNQSWVHAFLSLVDDEGDTALVTFGNKLANWSTDDLRKLRDSMTEHIEYLESIPEGK